MPSHQGVSVAWRSISNAAKLFIKLALHFWAAVPSCAAALPLLTQRDYMTNGIFCHRLLILKSFKPKAWYAAIISCLHVVWIVQQSKLLFFFKTGIKKSSVAPPFGFPVSFGLMLSIFFVTLVHTHWSHNTYSASILTEKSLKWRSLLPTQHQTASRHKSCLLQASESLQVNLLCIKTYLSISISKGDVLILELYAWSSL